MARVKLEGIKKVLFSTEVSVTIDQINYGNHLGNDRFLSIAHESRIRFLKELKQTELNFFGDSLIMSDSIVMYRSEVSWGEKLKVEIGINESNDYAFDMFYQITSLSDSREVARIKTGLTCFNYDIKKLCKWSTEAKNYLDSVTIVD